MFEHQSTDLAHSNKLINCCNIYISYKYIYIYIYIYISVINYLFILK